VGIGIDVISVIQ